MIHNHSENSIKEYPTVHRHDEALSFRAFRMEDHFNEVGGDSDAPHRHNFYTVLLVKKGNGSHTIDYTTYPIAARQLFFVSPGQVHHVAENECSYGYVLLFTVDFLRNSSIEVSFIENLQLFNDYGESPPLILTDQQLETLSGHCEQILSLEQSNLKYRDDAIGAMLKLFLIHANSYAAPEDDSTYMAGSGHDLLRRFKLLVEQNYNQWHDAASFANELGITADHLNRTVKTLIGKTVKDYIQSRLIVESKRLLAFSTLSNKEICFSLGFSDPANFSAFFKKHTGTSPSAFRKAQRG